MNMSDNINLENEELEQETEETQELEDIENEEAGESVPREEFDALNDKYIRLYAEYENFRKRTAKEKDEIYSSAAADVLKDILPVLDNFERALQFSGDEPEKVLEGIRMIEAQFANALAKIGVEEIQAAGEQFDPEVHYAVAHEQDENQLENTVTDVLQKGYIKGDRVIRPAMVKVVN
jgi:molecular chaperone GrpE